jgi:hypothetical protein
LPANDFVFALGGAGRRDSPRDFVTEPRNYAWLAGSVTRHITADDARELEDIAVAHLVAEDEL